MYNRIIRESSQGLHEISVGSYLAADRRLFLTGEVTDENCIELIKQLMYLSHEAPDKQITLYIDSCGGSVSAGLALYDTIMLLKAPIRTVVLGSAYSMGAILFLAGTVREMLPSSKVMIHDPSYGHASFAGKKPHQLQEEVNSLKECQKKLIDIICERTGRSRKEVSAKTRYDSFFSADRAIEFGLATGIAQSI